MIENPFGHQVLGIRVEAVKSRLHRARQMMREHLLASGYLAVEP